MHGYIDIILLVVCTSLGVWSGFVLGRRRPLPDFDADYEAGLVRETTEPEEYAEETVRIIESAPAPVFGRNTTSTPELAMAPATGTYEYLYRSDGTALFPAPEDSDDEVSATAFFASLNTESECLACRTGEGQCNCIEGCSSPACIGWASADAPVSMPMPVVSDETWKTDVMCQQMDRDTAEYMLRMETDTRTYLAGLKADGARHEYIGVVVQHDIAAEVGPITQPIAAITSGKK